MSRTASLPGVMTAATARQLSVSMGLDAEARALAVRNQPDVEAAALTQKESELVETIVGRKVARREEYEEAVAGIETLLATIDADDVDNLIADLDTRLTAVMAGVLQELGDVIRETGGLARQRVAELTAFQERNGLRERDAVYPASKVWHFGIVIVLVLAESLINATMYFGASAGGAASAMVTAICIATANVGVGVLAGLTWRYTATGKSEVV